MKSEERNQFKIFKIINLWKNHWKDVWGEILLIERNPICMNIQIYMITKYGWRTVYYLRKSRVYFFRLPDGTPIQVYPIW